MEIVRARRVAAEKARAAPALRRRTRALLPRRLGDAGALLEQRRVAKAVQQRACAELGLSRSDWTFFATLLQRRWDAAAEAAGLRLEGANRETTIPL